MRFDVITLFPDMIRTYTDESIIGRAQKAGFIEVHAHNFRDHSTDKRKGVDDTPYGGGLGMLLTAQPIVDCCRSIKKELKGSSRVIYMSPKGSVFCHKKALELAEYDNLILLCGHYEGIDQRALDEIVDEDISIGNFVLTGGELPAAMIIDAVSRIVPGVLADKECYEDESIAGGLLEYPHYTKPSVFEGKAVPEVLLKGNHGDIYTWRRHRSLELTLERRPELLKTASLTKDDIIYLEILSQKDK